MVSVFFPACLIGFPVESFSEFINSLRSWDDLEPLAVPAAGDEGIEMCSGPVVWSFYKFLSFTELGVTANVSLSH